MKRMSASVTLGVALFLLTPATAADEISGRWAAVLEASGQEIEYHADLVAAGKKLHGSWVSPRSGKYPIRDGAIDGSKLTFKVDRERDGSQFTLEFSCERKDKGLVGTVSLSGSVVGEVKLKRVGNPVGEWNVTSKSPNGEQTFESTLTIKHTDSGLKGQVKGRLGEVDLESAAFDGAEFVVKFTLEFQGNDVPLSVRAEFKDEDHLVGRWMGTEGDFSGEWTAKRAAKPVDLTGEWDVVSTVGEEEYPSKLHVKKDGDAYKAVSVSDNLGENAYQSMTFKDGAIRGEIVLPIEGQDVTFVVEAKLEKAGRLAGVWVVKGNDEYTGRWVAERREPEKPKANVFGEWDMTALVNGDELDVNLKIGKDGDKVTGKVYRDEFSIDLYDIKISADTVKFSFDYGDGGVRVDLVAKVEGGKLKGEWEAADGNSGEWRANRKEKQTTRL